MKNLKDRRLSKKIPTIKKVLETSLLRIKQMLEAKNCHSAFWVGNLKHRDLDGKELCSQVPVTIQQEKHDTPSHPDSESDAELMKLDSESDSGSVTGVSEGNEDPTLAISLI